ncbi:MAG: phenylacetate--CoA ligase family protein [Rhodospirillales bacterium]|nr:MAG: phenylacetate--CoA ligase family protein [Rhodospirillales bacterium]
MSAYFDELETRSADVREADITAGLRRQIARARAHAPAFAERLADVEPDAITGRGSLAPLPVTRKSDLIRLQSERPSFGGLAAIDPGAAGRIFVSPGPIYEFEARTSDYGRMARAFFAAGFRPGEIVHNTFAYHLSPGGWIMDAGARALGCAVVPAGVGNTEQQVQAIAHLRPEGYAGTPDHLKVLLDKGDELGVDVGSITKALVSGGALFPAVRDGYAARGVTVRQCYATAELGLIAYESVPGEGMIIDEGVVVEIVRPGTGDPVPDGEVGEVVVTTFNPDYPLIRFATGDLSAVLPGTSPCGRTNMRIKGWMGRADQTAKVKGLFVHPEQVAAVAARHPEIRRGRLVIRRSGDADTMTLHCEVAGRTDGLAAAIGATLTALTQLKGEVVLDDRGSLANDGKVIDDQREYA